MKKLLAILFVLMIPAMAFSMDVITDSEMEQVTGQSGVAIMADDMKFFIDIDYIRWTDPDGFGASAQSPGAIGIDNFQAMININAITSVTTTSVAYVTTEDGHTIGAGGPLSFASAGRDLLGGNYAAAIAKYDFTNNQKANGVGTRLFKLKPLTIDIVGDGLDWAQYGFGYNKGVSASIPVSFVAIGLPTLEISISAMDFDVALYDINDGNSANDAIDGTSTTDTTHIMGTLEIVL
jgi:hypothetical protein